MVGILLSYWEGPFSGAMLVSGRVYNSWMMKCLVSSRVHHSLAGGSIRIFVGDAIYETFNKNSWLQPSEVEIHHQKSKQIFRIWKYSILKIPCPHWVGDRSSFVMKSEKWLTTAAKLLTFCSGIQTYSIGTSSNEIDPPPNIFRFFFEFQLP